MPKKRAMHRKVDALRKNITVPFAIRGTSRERSFSTTKTIPGIQKYPSIYVVNPLYKMGSKEWVERLHATVHATVSRGIRHGWIRWENWRKTPASELPTIMVFGPPRIRDSRSGKKTLLQERKLYKALNPHGEQNIEFRPHREVYEWGIVHGTKQPTFREGELDGIYREKGFNPWQKKLFEVRITPKEFEGVMNGIEKRLKETGLPSIRGLFEQWQEAKMDKEKMKNLWEKVVALVSPHTKFQFTRETSPRHPAEYLFYLEASKLLSNKLVKKGLNWIKQNIKD